MTLEQFHTYFLSGEWKCSENATIILWLMIRGIHAVKEMEETQMTQQEAVVAEERYSSHRTTILETDLVEKQNVKRESELKQALYDSNCIDLALDAVVMRNLAGGGPRLVLQSLHASGSSL